LVEGGVGCHPVQGADHGHRLAAHQLAGGEHHGVASGGGPARLDADGRRIEGKQAIDIGNRGLVRQRDRLLGHDLSEGRNGQRLDGKQGHVLGTDLILGAQARGIGEMSLVQPHRSGGPVHQANKAENAAWSLGGQQGGCVVVAADQQCVQQLEVGVALADFDRHHPVVGAYASLELSHILGGDHHRLTQRDDMGGQDHIGGHDLGGGGGCHRRGGLLASDQRAVDGDRPTRCTDRGRSEGRRGETKATGRSGRHRSDEARCNQQEDSQPGEGELPGGSLHRQLGWSDVQGPHLESVLASRSCTEPTHRRSTALFHNMHSRL